MNDRERRVCVGEVEGYEVILNGLGRQLLQMKVEVDFLRHRLN